MNETTTTSSPLPPDLHIPPSKHTVSVSIINTTSTINGAKTSDFFGPPIKGHKWLAAPVFSFLIQHHGYGHNDAHKAIPARTRNLLFDLGIREDWWNSAPSLVDGLRSTDLPWRLKTEKSVWDILGQAAAEASSGKGNDYAAGGHRKSSESGPDALEVDSARNVDARSETACDIASGSSNNINVTTTTTTTSAAFNSNQHGENITTERHPRGGEKRAGDTSRTCDIDRNTIEAIIWSHHHFDHTGDPSLFPSHRALIVGPDVKDALLPGYPDGHDSTILKSDYDGREVIGLDFETGTAPSDSNDEDMKGKGEKNEKRRFKTLTIGQLPAIDYFGDGSFYLLDTPGHAVGHICALARVTSSSSWGGGRETRELDPRVPDTFVLLAGDAFHHPGEIRPSIWRKVPERLSVTLAATAAERTSASKGIVIQDVLSKKDHHTHSGANQHQHGSKSGDRFRCRHSLSASRSQNQAASNLHSDSASSESESVPLVGMDIEDASPFGTAVGTQSDIAGPDGVGGGRVVADMPVSGASAAGAMLRSQGENKHMQQHGPQAVGDGRIKMSVMEGRTEPGGDRSGTHRPLEPNLNLTQTTETSSYYCSAFADGAAVKAASAMENEASTARARQFTLPGDTFTMLLPHFDPNRGDEFENGSFYYPAGSPLCHSIAKHEWHHNPAQATATLHKLQEFDAQRNILVLAAHDESLLALDSSIWFPRGTLDNWFEEGLKDKLHWHCLVDFLGAIPLSGCDTCNGKGCDTAKEEKQAPASAKEEKGREGDSPAPTGFGAGTSRADHHLALLKRWWETRKDYWGPIGLESV